MKNIFIFLTLLLLLVSCNNDNNDDKHVASDEEQQETADDVDFCSPNPCLDIDWSDGKCTETENGFNCGCDENYTWDGNFCAGDTREVECLGLPENAIWNSVEKITQTWTEGSYWDPPQTGEHNETESKEECRFKCIDGLGWRNGECKPKWQVIALGTNHSCGIHNGRLYCWGSGHRGQRGDGTEEKSEVPVQILLDRDTVSKRDRLWKSVSAGEFHTCGVLENGELYCWGDNESYQLGDGTKERKLFPSRVIIGEDEKIIEVSSKGEHTCVLNSDGDLYCWGNNRFGYLGDGTEISRKRPKKIAADIGPWLTVSAGWSHTCAINKNGELYCWGINARGALGYWSTELRSLVPVRVGEESDWTYISAGGGHTCGIRSGELYCWGGNNYGEVGDGNLCDPGDSNCGNRYTPYLVKTVNDDCEKAWIMVSAGFYDTGAVKENGNFYSWGYNRDYNLGDGTNVHRPYPQHIEGKWKSVFMGGTTKGKFSCGIDELNDLYCWGRNLLGQLGIGTDIDAKNPTKVEIWTEDTEDTGNEGDGGNTGSTGEMVSVPAGSFRMGCNEAVNDECQDREKPYREITLSSYEIDKYPVTTEEYQKCVDAGDCNNNSSSEPHFMSVQHEPYCNLAATGKDKHPMNCVSWFGAKAYCEWAGKRLPTEAEWEKAARGPDGRKYPWGNTPEVSCEYAVMNYGCGTGGTMPVGSKPLGVSPYGAYDMIGNVWEWVNDWYSGSYYSESPGTDPQGPESGTSRIIRGGSWDASYTDSLTVFNRGSFAPAIRYGRTYGFRCAKTE